MQNDCNYKNNFIEYKIIRVLHLFGDIYMALKIKKRAAKKSAPTKKRGTKKVSKASEENKKAYWEAYKQLQKRVDAAWDKLQQNVLKKASPSVLIRDKNNLLLLLGECNYMARECMELSAKAKKRK
jgi:hypothetical protein